MAPGAGDGAPSERKPKAKLQPRAEGSKAGARSTPKRPGSGRRPASAGSGAPGSGKKRVKKKLTICLSGCKYDLISRITEELGYRTVEEEEPWNLQWIDTSVSTRVSFGKADCCELCVADGACTLSTTDEHRIAIWGSNHRLAVLG